MSARSSLGSPWNVPVKGAGPGVRPVFAADERRVKTVGGPAVEALGWARLALAAVLGLRLALSPFAAAVGQPDALWLPRGTGLVFASPPPVALVIGIQVAGVAGAALYVWRRRLAPLVLAWVCLLVLAGLRTSLGKILHNDILLLVAAVPLLLAGPLPVRMPARRRRPPVPSVPGLQVPLRRWIPASDLLAPQRKRRLRRSSVSARAGGGLEEDARTGLDAAAAIVVLAYVSAAWWKLVREGPAWALSDNLRWSLAAGRNGSRWPALSDWLVDRPSVCVGLACGILILEVGAAAVWFRPAFAPWFVASAALLHASTWLVLGLDYWTHLAAVALVLLPWARMRRR